MYAVFATGGKQFKVSEGDRLRVEKLEGEVGGKVLFDQVLMVGGEGDPKIGTPMVKGVTVEATIESQARDKKITVFKFKRREKYRKKYGHRQPFTALKITKINS